MEIEFEQQASKTFGSPEIRKRKRLYKVLLNTQEETNSRAVRYKGKRVRSRTVGLGPGISGKPLLFQR